jgi:hypothetical protein
MKLSFGSGRVVYYKGFKGTVVSMGLMDASQCTQENGVRYHWLYINYFAPAFGRLLKHIWES